MWYRNFHHLVLVKKRTASQFRVVYPISTQILVQKIFLKRIQDVCTLVIRATYYKINLYLNIKIT